MAATLEGALVNDVHSKLNQTAVDGIRRPRAIEDLQAIVRAARDAGSKISIAGGRHAMGGQQFGERTILIDMTAMDRVLSFDAARGLVTSRRAFSGPLSFAR